MTRNIPSEQLQSHRWLALPAKYGAGDDNGPSAKALRAAAEMAQQERDWALASLAWAEFLSVEPEAYDGWLRQGEALREAGDFEGAITSFKKAQSLAPEEIDPLVSQANTYERMADWRAAAAAWSRLLKNLADSGRQGTMSALLLMAYLHAINTHRLSNKLERAREMMVEAALVLPDIVRNREFRLMKAQINKTSAPEESFSVLAELVRDLPEREDIRFDAASVALSLGQYEVGTEIITPCLRAGQDESFFRLAIDHLERCSDWKAMLSLYDSFHMVRQSESLTSRILAAAVKTRDVVHARWIALSIARRTRTLDAIHILAVAYEQNGELDRARLLIRFLRRAWPHSAWHKAQYINLVARTKGLTAADKALRDRFEPSWQDKEAAGAYSEAPFLAREFREAVRRLRRYLGSHPGDVRRSVLLGYALANSEGLAAAEHWFEEVACETFQGEDALVGLAYMAMWRRDRELTCARWAKVVSLHPSHTIAMVEYARALYALGDPDRALAVADRRLHSLPGDVTMREFKLWLHSAIGQPHEALKESRALTKYAGRTWSAVKHGIRSAALTGAFEEQQRWLLDTVPTGTSKADSSQLYEVVRVLVTSKLEHAIPDFIQAASIPSRYAGWLSTYMGSEAAAPAGDRDGRFVAYIAACKAAHDRFRSHTRADRAEQLGALSDEDVEAIVRGKNRGATIHIVNKFEEACGGSELHALDLAARLRQFATVRLWAPEAPHPDLAEVQGMDMSAGRAPHGGVVVLIGVYFDVASWIAFSKPERVIILYNTFAAPSLHEKVNDIYARTGVKAEIVFCSDMMQTETGIKGLFEPSPTDLELFSPVERGPMSGPLKIGRHSRDVVEKHDFEDKLVYEAVARLGGVSEILGGTCMRPMFGNVEGLHLLPARSDRIAEFLQGLDIFFYRTSTWAEAWGRVIIEAMACGLPVVVDACTGAAQVITHGVDGFIVGNTQEAIAAITALYESADLRRSLGRQARARVSELLSKPAIDRLAAFYLM